MEELGRRLRERARALHLSDAEVARSAGLAERRYGHYVRGTREPDLSTLLRICGALGATPNDLLLGETKADEREALLSRLSVTAQQLPVSELPLAIQQLEALAAHRTGR